MLTVSGTMSNVVAMRTTSSPGATAIVEQSAHLYGMEFGGIAAACGLLVLPVPGTRGAIDPDALQVRACRKADAGFPGRGILCLENTHNAAGGTVIPPRAPGRRARRSRTRAGLSVHLDGARIFNAAVAPGGMSAISRARSIPCRSVSRRGCRRRSARCSSGPARSSIAPAGSGAHWAGPCARPGSSRRRGSSRCGRWSRGSPRITRTPRGSPGRSAVVDGLSIDLASVQSNIVNVDVGGLGSDGGRVRGAPVTHAASGGCRDWARVIRFVTYRGHHTAGCRTRHRRRHLARCGPTVGGVVKSMVPARRTQTASRTTPRRVRPVARPTQRPMTPQPQRKQSE